MILPIVGYGDPILRKKCDNIDSDYPEINELVDNMFETMRHASGVGLAAPQIGLAIRLFVVDCSPFSEDDDLSVEEQSYLRTFQRTFINAKIIKEEGKEWSFNEGCLSIPGVRENVKRKSIITIEYLDENFNQHTEVLDGYAARVVQHEYDHIEGILFTDKLSGLKKKLNNKKLQNIIDGKVFTDYKMKLMSKRNK